MLRLINKYKNKHKLTNCINEGKFKSTGKKSARIYFRKPLFLYNEKGEFIKEFKDSKECSKKMNITLLTIEKILGRKKRFGLNIKYKFQFSRIKHEFLPPLLNIGSRSNTAH